MIGKDRTKQTSFQPKIISASTASPHLPFDCAGESTLPSIGSSRYLPLEIIIIELRLAWVQMGRGIMFVLRTFPFGFNFFSSSSEPSSHPGSALMATPPKAQTYPSPKISWLLSSHPHSSQRPPKWKLMSPLVSILPT